MRNAIRPRQERERGKIGPRDELKRYLEGPLGEGIIDVVRYWGVSFDFNVLDCCLMTYY